MIMRVLMDTGETHDVTEAHVYTGPLGDLRLALVTDADKAITLQVDQAGLMLLADTCADAVFTLQELARQRKAGQN